MSSGRPVVTNAVGSVQEYLTDKVDAYIADKFEARYFVKKITEIIEDPKTANRIGQAGKKLAYEKLSNLTKNCLETKKEAQFMMSLPYNEIFVQSNIKDKVLVQGVVDLIVIFDDHIDIVDYKYSSLNSESLKQKYFTQLHLYKIATQKAHNKNVSNCYIYSIKTGE